MRIHMDFHKFYARLTGARMVVDSRAEVKLAWSIEGIRYSEVSWTQSCSYFGKLGSAV